MRMFNFHLAMAFTKQKTKKKTRPGEAKDGKQRKKQDLGRPGICSRPKNLSEP